MKMLINATRAEQLRVAVVDGTTLQEYQVQIDESGLTRGNIYRGIVANIQPSLNAAFIDIGEERHGFLPVSDILESAYQQTPPKKNKRPSIDQVLRKGQPILVQVTKDGVGQKGAALTTSIALAGRYLVLTPFDGVRGISRKAEDDKDRKTIKGRLKKLDLPDGHGVIVRTNGIDQNQATLNRDMNALLRLWRKVQGEAGRGKGPRLLYSDQDLVVQALRDYLDPEIREVVVDSDEVHEKAEDYMKAFMPRSKTKLVRYKDALPLFSRYRLETQIDKIYERTASLPSGGSIVIDLTEALTAIDVNSGRATRNSNHEDSIFKINCEAAKEVARQLRLRDIGGLVVVDFIDMRLRKHQARLERTMRDAMKPDKARYSVGRVSPNGLLEINRQRIKQSLRLRTHRPCPTCNGQATIPTPEFAALRLLSRIEGRAASGRVKHVTVALHPEMADMLQNHFRRELMGLEQDHGIEVEVLASSTLRRTEERLEWEERSDEEAKAREKARRKEPAFSSTDLTAESRKRNRRSRKTSDDDSKTQNQRQQQKSKSQSQSKSQSSRRRKNEQDDEQQETQQQTKSRRRRSRRRKDDEPSQDQSQTAQQAKKDDESDDDNSSRRRRRRRGGRGRRSRRGSDDVSSQDQQSAQGKSSGSDDESRSDSTSDDKTTSRRRRSRSRSRSRGDDSNQRTSKPASQQAKSSKSDDGDGDQKVVRRRRRSRRSSSDDAESAPAKSAKSTNSDQAGKAGQPKDDGGDGETKTRRRRSRSRSSSRRSGSSGDDGSEGKTRGAKESSRQSASDDSSKKTSDQTSDGDTTRRRRSRSRSRSRGSSESGGEPAQQASEESGNAGGNSGNHGGSNGDSHSATGVKAKAEEPSAPVGVLAGQGVEPKPTKKRRWAWWGGPSDPAPDPNE